ncbi:PKD domain-containing protein [Pseudoflavitalea sp. G-6-1-2]|uniref:DUF7948 domain-containing protein n=1 Tax=Pseudoflavitalea sp. G-6-1-2 TaxID=2728841 RepID=UPI001F0DA560|nr:PKD domain-containing protein [Pseudoflavitalea sp. G-6-1-2]
MGRKNLIAVALLCFATLKAAAQSDVEPFEFVQNKGQWDKDIKFKGQLNTGAFFLTARGFTVDQRNPADLKIAQEQFHGKKDGKGGGPVSRPPRNRSSASTNSFDPEHPDNGSGGGGGNPIPPLSMPIRAHTYMVEFEGGNPNAEIVPDKLISDEANYFLGNDPSKWARNVGSYQGVTYKSIYPNIDVRYYSDYGNLKYDIIVHPGGDPRQIRMRYTGADKLSIRNQELLIKTSVGTVRERYPYAYQFDMANGKKDVDCRFQLANSNTVTFNVKEYSGNSTLIIDPTVIFVSFTGSKANEFGFTATPGPDGSLYSGSIVFGTGFRTSPGAYKTEYQGPANSNALDVGIFKFTPNGQRAWATYLGGLSHDLPHSLICDKAGNVIVLGRTYSGSSFPATKTISTGSGDNADLFVAKISVDGRDLIGAIRIGGRDKDCVNVYDKMRSGGDGPKETLRFYGDDSRSEVVVDGDDNVYVAAQTQSSDWPTTAGVFQPNFGGAQDGVVLKLNKNCDDLVWTSYLGGAGYDGAFVLAVHPVTKDIYVAGVTNTPDLDGSPAGVYQPRPGGGYDGYVMQIANDGSRIIKRTYLGTQNYDAIYGIRFDRKYFPYVMGITEGGNWPIVNAPYNKPGASQFIVKFKQDLSGVEYSTTWGNGSKQPNISPVAFLVDRCENIYISGWGGWIDTNTDPYATGGISNMPLKDQMKSITDGRDFYFFVMEKNAAGLLYGSYFGQNGGEGEHVDGGTSRYDELGVIYQAICANCFKGFGMPITTPFPVTPNVWSQVNGTGGTGCNLAAVKIRFNFAGVISAPKSFYKGKPDSRGCAPFTVDFRDTINNGKTYKWDFDDDGADDVTGPTSDASHRFDLVGRHRVRLVVEDPNTCNVTDTAYIFIEVGNNPAIPDFNFTKIGACNSTEYTFDNTTIKPAAGPDFDGNTFRWEWGDGAPGVVRNADDINHTFFGPGTYPVKLIVQNPAYCNAPDTLTKNLRIAANVRAQFQTPPMGCQPYTAVFTNTSIGGTRFEWDFGDGTTSTEESPTHLYPNLNTYVVKLRAYDESTCNKVHDTSFTITVNPKPLAAFDFEPKTAVANKPVIFYNQSIGGTNYKWEFGDGEERLKNNMDTTMHQYNASANYLARLITFNQYGCSDTTEAKMVDAIVRPLLDVPNAFTPGRGGRNSTIKVEGFGIHSMLWRIYNRNGQMVYETNSRFGAWDGTFKGQLQPMDVYVYTLEVVFTDGTKLSKRGDITLIR